MNQVVTKKSITVPMIITRGLVIFPKTLTHFDMVRKKSIAALEQAMVENQMAFLAMQQDITEEDPHLSRVETVGTVCRIKQVVKMPNSMVRVLVEGLYRAEIEEVISTRQFPTVLVTELSSEDEASGLRIEALKRRCIAEFQRYCGAGHKANPEMLAALENMEDPEELADTIGGNIHLRAADKQELLEIIDITERLEAIIGILIRETEILEIDNDINHRVKAAIDQNQKEYFLREQMKVIQEELGDKEGVGLEIQEYIDNLTDAGVPEAVFVKCEKELNRLQKMQYGNPEGTVIRTYVEWMCDLPWQEAEEDGVDLDKATAILDRDHFGLKKVKERVLEYLAVKKITGSLSGPILCLVGPPGVGKTSIAKSVAESLGRQYVRISLGGIRDEADIRGHRKTYIGSMPGRIMQGMKQAGTKNPLMLFDEIDKMGSDHKGDPASALLEVLDSEQNSKFRDHFLEVDYDLSKVLFIATANTLDTVPKPLLDRMEIIELPGYTAEDKFQIAKRHLLPKQRKTHGLTGQTFKITDKALRDVIDYYTKEAGVRELERTIAKLCRKADLLLAKNEQEAVRIGHKDLEAYLGKHRYEIDMVGKQDEVGVVCGLAWTQVGGDTLQVEAGVVPGTGKVELTGHLGDVMKESAKAAISYVRSCADTLGIPADFYQHNDIHIHVPEGATPKDGPSAGITIATALISALTGKKVCREVAMTGEITLRGRVLAIGGLKEKTLAAYRAGIKKVLIPSENVKDMEELEAVVVENVEIIPVSHMSEVQKIALR